MLQHNLKIAFRSLWKYKTQNLINIIGLSVSLACFAFCFSMVRSITGMDKEFPGVDKMYTIMLNDGNYPVISPFLGDCITKECPEVEKYTSIEFPGNFVFESDDKKYNLNTSEVMPSFFEFFSIPFIGHANQAYKTLPNSIILTQSTATKLYGTEPAIGKQITTNRRYFTGQEMAEKEIVYTVCGVIKNFSDNSYFVRYNSIDILFVNDELGNYFNPDKQVNSTSAITILTLNKNVSVKQFNEKFVDFPSRVAGKYHYTHHFDRYENGFYLHPFSKTQRESMGFSFYIIVGLFGGIGFLVLLVAVFNYASYSVNLFLNKGHECAIRKSANAGRWHLFFLFFTETAIIIILSGLFALVWVDLFGTYFKNLCDNIFKISIAGISGQVVQYTVIGLVIAFMLYVFPVDKINRKSIKDTLFGGKSKNPTSKSRNILLGLQFFLSTIFISASFFLYLQLNHISAITVDTLTKEAKNNIIEINLQNKMLLPHFDNIVQKFRTNPDIEDLFLSNNQIAGGGSWMTSLKYDDKEVDFYKMNYMQVGYNYFDFINLKPIEGRLWNEGENAIIISKKAKELLEDENVLGKTILNYRESYTIVGIVDNIVNNSTHDEQKAAFYFPVEENRYSLVYARINPAKKKECYNYINKIVREYLPETMDFKLSSLSENISGINKFENVLFNLIILFTAISVVISLFGVYAVVTLTTKRRQKEVAIRKINGATLFDIIGLFLRTYLSILLIAVIPAFVAIYFAVNKWLEIYVYRISVSWLIFVLIFAVLAALLILTIIYQLVKVARINPAEIIKSE